MQALWKPQDRFRYVAPFRARIRCADTLALTRKRREVGDRSGRLRLVRCESADRVGWDDRFAAEAVVTGHRHLDPCSERPAARKGVRRAGRGQSSARYLSTGGIRPPITQNSGIGIPIKNMIQ
jgi:hypothetical protein